MLSDLIVAAMKGTARWALVQGDAGIGKTSLLDAVAAQAGTAGFRVLHASAWQSDPAVPFSAFNGCLGPADKSVLRPERYGADWELSLADVLIERLSRLCLDSPVALVMDDLHKADLSSLVLLNRLLKSSRAMPLLVCMAASSNARGGLSASMLRSWEQGGMQQLVLPPLNQESVTALVSRLVGGRPTQAVLAQLSGAAGNPLLITEAVSALVAGRRLLIADGEADLLPPGEVAGAVGGTETVTRRLAMLSPDTHRALAAAAALGSGISLSELATITSIPVAELWRAAREGIEAGLVDAGEESLSFRHELIRHVLVDGMPQSDRVSLLRQAGPALINAGAPPDVVAPYVLLENAPWSDWSLDWLDDSAPALLALSPGTAVDLLVRALESVRDDAPRSWRFREALIAALLKAQEPEQAEVAARSALAELRGDVVRSDFQWLLMRSLLQQARYEEAAEEATTLAPAIDQARFYAFAAHCWFLLGRFDESRSAAQQAVAIGEDHDTIAAAYGCEVQGLILLAGMQPDAALHMTERAVALFGNQQNRPEMPTTPHITQGLVLLDMDRLAESHAALDQGLRDCGADGRTAMPWYHLGKAVLGYREGRWDDAMAEIGAGLESADGPGPGGALTSQAALIAVHRGDREAYGQDVEQGDESLGGLLYGFLRIWARALTWEAGGDRRRALDLLAGSWPTSLHAGGRRLLGQVLPDAVRIAADLGDTESLRTFADDLAAETTRMQNLALRSAALFAQGLVEQDPSLLLRSADSFSATSILHEGYAREQAAIVLARQGHPVTARQALQGAVAAYDRLGARWDAERARHTLSGVGVRLRPGDAAHLGWEALTETERGIAGYVSEGWSNPEIGARMFLSPRTVQFHLSTIFNKLSIESRVELAVEARRHTGA